MTIRLIYGKIFLSDSNRFKGGKNMAKVISVVNQKGGVDTIRQECFKMERLLENKKEWGAIWQVAYGIHNLPCLLVR